MLAAADPTPRQHQQELTTPGVTISILFDRLSAREDVVAKSNLFELLGQPVTEIRPDAGTSRTLAPAETYDDDGLLPSMADVGTSVTKVEAETADDDGLLPSIADFATSITRVESETRDDDGLLPLL